MYRKFRYFKISYRRFRYIEISYRRFRYIEISYRNFRYIELSYGEFRYIDISYRNFDTSKHHSESSIYRNIVSKVLTHRMERVLPSISWHLPVFYAHTERKLSRYKVPKLHISIIPGSFFFHVSVSMSSPPKQIQNK